MENARKKGEGLRGWLDALLPAQRTELLDAIEAARAAREISPARLASAAELSERWYRKLLQRPEKASARTLTRLFRALQDDGQKAVAGGEPMLRPLYGLTLAIVAAMQGIDVAQVRAVLARPGERTFSAEWRAASGCRELALYLLNQILGQQQVALARMAGLSKPAVSIAMRRAEDKRDDPKIARMLEILEGILGGE